MAMSNRTTLIPFPVFSTYIFFNNFFLFQMRSAVRDVSKFFPTAIISGRKREKVSGESVPKFSAFWLFKN